MQKFFSFFFFFLLIAVLIYNEKEKNVNIESQYAEPDKYARFFYEISYLEEGPNYYPGYKQIELNKMLDQLNDSRLSASNNQGDGDIPFSSSAAATATFTERGPNDVPGRTRGVVVDAADASGNTWYAAGVGGGLWKGVYNSTTTNVSWTNMTPLTIQNLAIVTLAQSASNPNIIYAGTGESALGASTAIDGDGIFKIDVSDASSPVWTNISPKVGGLIDHRFGSVNRVIVDPSNADIIVANTYSFSSTYKTYIFKSTDGGSNWTEVYEDNVSGDIQQIVAAPTDFNIQYAGFKRNKVLKSIDAGSNWNETADFGIPEYGRVELVVSNTNPNKVYAGVRNGSSGPSYLFRTVDGGNSWYQIQENATSGDVNHSPDYWLNQQGWRDNTLGVNPYDDDILYGGGVYLYKFTVLADSTKITEAMASGPHVDHQFIQGIKDGGGVNFRLLNASDGGVAYTTQVTSNPGMSFGDWKRANDGFNTSQFYGADKINGRQQYIGGMQDNGTQISWPSSENASATTDYALVVGGDGFEVIAHWNNPDSMMGGSQYNGLRRSLDGALTWNSISSGMSGSSIAPFLVRLSSPYHEPDVVYAIHDTAGVWKSTDFGATWNLKTISDGGWKGYRKDVEVSLANPRFVWAGSRIGNEGGNLYLSKDWGESFSPVSDPIPDYNNISSSGIYSHPNEDSTAYVLVSFFGRAKIFETKDLGVSWTDISGFPANWEKGVSNRGFPNVKVFSLCVMPFDPNVIWAGTDIGIVETTDRGASWNIISSNLPHVNIWDMKIKDQGEIVIATHGRGIWTATIPDLINSEPKENSITITSNGSQNINIEENGGVATITATATRDVNPALPVVVSLSAGGTASASDYTLSSNTITIASGKSGTATVTALNDLDVEPLETVVIDISSVTNGKEAGTQQVTISIMDGDNTVTGVEDLLSGKAISIYPNPNSGIFKVRFNDTWKGNVDLRVLDIFGRAQYLRRIDNTSGQVEHEVDISNKTDGIFVLEIVQGDKRVIRKIVKQ